MPTFPRFSLSFRTAGFPQYGWKAGFPSGALAKISQVGERPEFFATRSGSAAPLRQVAVNGLGPPSDHILQLTGHNPF